MFSRVNDSENVDAFESIGVTAIDPPTATEMAIDDEIERPAITHWMNELGDGYDVQEVEVTSENLAGKTIEELGDHVTFVGEADAVKRAMNRFHPHD